MFFDDTNDKIVTASYIVERIPILDRYNIMLYVYICVHWILIRNVPSEHLLSTQFIAIKENKMCGF